MTVRGLLIFVAMACKRVVLTPGIVSNVTCKLRVVVRVSVAVMQCGASSVVWCCAVAAWAYRRGYPGGAGARYSRQGVVVTALGDLYIQNT